MQCASEAARHSSALLRRARSSIIIIHRWREGEGCRWEIWEFIHSFISPGSERAPLDSSGWGAFQKSSLVQIWLILCGSLTGGWKEPMAFLPFSCHRPHKLGRLPRPPSPLQLDPTTFLLHVAMPRHHGGAPSKDAPPRPRWQSAPQQCFITSSLNKRKVGFGPMDGTHPSSRRSLWEVKWAYDLSWGHIVLSHRCCQVISFS